MGQRTAATILHVDLDSFYAAVEQRTNPALRGKPVMVGGGVVLAATYEARRFGVRSGMPIGKAKRLCPEAIVVSGQFSDYGAASKEVFEVCRRFTPFIEQISIDEAFLDVGGARRLLGEPSEIARGIRKAVLDDTQLVVSIGVARTKFLAKVGSRVAKPDGLVVVEPADELRFLHALSVDYIWGVGPVMHDRLAEMGIHSIADLAAVPARTLAARLGGGVGHHLHALAWNRDPRGVITRRRAGSVGAQSTFGRDVRDPDIYRRVLQRLGDRVGSRLRAKDRAGRTVTLRVRFADFRTVTRSRTLSSPTNSTAALVRVALHLLSNAVADPTKEGLRLLGISVSNLAKAPPLQLELPLDGLEDDPLIRPGSQEDLTSRLLDGAVDDVRDRYGKELVGRASVMLSGRRDGLVPVAFSDLIATDE